jgi:hypothetical protein
MQITFNETEVTSAMERYVRMRLRLKPEDVCVFEFTATRGVVGGVRAVVDITEAEDFVPEELVRAPVSAPQAPAAPAPKAVTPVEVAKPEPVKTPDKSVPKAEPEPEAAKQPTAAVQLFAGLS